MVFTRTINVVISSLSIFIAFCGNYIYDHHGDFATTVTSDVEAVISGNVLDVTQKMIAAAKLGIPVLDIREFSERYDVPLQRFETEEPRF